MPIEHIWDKARSTRLLRKNKHGETEKLDYGVNFFVLALEHHGVKTRWSCEGHPRGFYITFEARQEFALRIKRLGYFTVELEGHNYWSIRLTGNEQGMGEKWSERIKRQVLRSAAETWVKNLI